MMLSLRAAVPSSPSAVSFSYHVETVDDNCLSLASEV